MPTSISARRPHPLELLGLVAAIVPTAVAVVRAAAIDWMPVGDAADFTVRSRDVLTDHHPLVGAWSSGSAVVGVAVNNLGPLQLDLLAPFTKVSPYLGTAAGAAFLNAASVVIVFAGSPTAGRYSASTPCSSRNTRACASSSMSCSFPRRT